MFSRNRSLFFSVLITALIAGTVIYVFGVKNNLPPAGSQIFSPNDVIGLTWTLNDTVFEFHRDMNSQAWSPEVEPTRINKKIETLSQLTVSAIDPQNFELEGGLTITLQFRDGTSWTGVLSQDYFIWKTGPLENSGTELGELELEMFNEGRFAFEPLTWDWCSNNLRKITYELNEETIELVRSGDEWEVTNLSGDPKIVETNWAEDWIEKSCQVDVVAWIDIKLEPFGLDEGSFEIVTSTSRTEYAVSAPVVQISEEKAMLSPAFFQRLDDLIQAP